ncbi:poly(hydroxyalkanoate) depolymerase family esterase [Oxalobacteraceae bacterium GrIS 1.11]
MLLLYSYRNREGRSDACRRERGGVAMVKAATSWLRGLLRAGKLADSLFGRPARKAAAKTKPKAKPKAKAAPAARAKPAALTPQLAKPKVAGAPVRAKPAPPAALPGKWLAAYYSPPPEVGKLAGQRMSYYLYLPDKAPSETVRRKGRSLIVMLHGCDQTATQFAEGSRMNRLAEKKGYAVLYPQQSLRAHPHRCWKWYDKATQAGRGDVGMIVGVIEQVLARYPIDRARIYIAGMSAGAGMANIVALNHPDLIAALGLHSGPVFGAGHGMIGALGVMRHGASARVDAAILEVLARNPAFPSMPTILIQGEGDQVVRPINQTQLMRQSQLLNRMPGATAATVEMTPPHAGRNPAHAYQVRDFQVGKQLLLRVAQVEQLAHAWSGGDPSLPFNAKPGPDASKMLLDFFSLQRRV